jgi:hypothetical protein
MEVVKMANKVVELYLSSEPTFQQGMAGEAITPGHCVDLQSDDTYDKASVAGRLQAVARINDLVGPTDAQRDLEPYDVPWSADENFQMVVPKKGDRINFLSAHATDIAKGDEIEIDATTHGCVKIQAAGIAIAIALEAKTGDTLGRLKCRIL